MVELVQLLLLGVFSGFVAGAGLLGVGGGLIIVPALLYVLAAEVHEVVLMHTAIGTALFVIVFTSISSVWAHPQNGGSPLASLYKTHAHYFTRGILWCNYRSILGF
ncbi:TSUP family transporter [Isorropodon fossajaponicum symbiont]|uniref:TSUP family transporter n=1 Tax=Isorropodon fossajaponicum symbiont TaxID=883811 RepID=UPI001CEC1042|nr:TSUP family transporter [Isorropodon fossajaponicum symbiont]